MLHPSIETTAQTGQVGTGTQISGYPTNRDLAEHLSGISMVTMYFLTPVQFAGDPKSLRSPIAGLAPSYMTESCPLARRVHLLLGPDSIREGPGHEFAGRLRGPNYRGQDLPR